MTQPTPQDDARTAASEILKRVDQLIKAGEIDQSIREIIHAKEIDPANAYIHAYEERLVYLKEEHEKNVERERTRKEAEEAARKRDEEARRQREEERRRQEERSKADQERARAIEVRQSLPPPAATNDPEKTYADALRKAWATGNITPQQAIALEKLRGEIGISPERQLQIDTRILSELGPEPVPETILVVDDDKEMLFLISQMLTLHGYQVTTLTTSDEAYTLLKKWKPRLILGDVNLETSTMGGFSFFEKVREMKHLMDVPFIFLTGLSDEAIVRTGKELGVDDYLTKPVSEENLMATVKGKLKRFSHYNKES